MGRGSKVIGIMWKASFSAEGANPLNAEASRSAYRRNRKSPRKRENDEHRGQRKRDRGALHCGFPPIRSWAFIWQATSGYNISLKKGEALRELTNFRGLLVPAMEKAEANSTARAVK
jgi:hypothetical protein